MKKLSKSVLALFIALFLSSLNVNASYVVGSHIGYKAIDSTNYEVTLTVFRDCNSLIPNSVKIGVLGKPSGYFEKTAVRVSTKDITGAYLKCNFVSRCTGSYTYGFVRVEYKDTINIATGACKYTFSYNECCRNSAITTGGANTLHYNYAEVNKCFGLNNSTQADLEPRLLLPVGEDVLMTSFIGDKMDKQDSVVYALRTPLDGIGKQITYSGAWNTQRPITFLGYPNTTLNLPAGFHFNTKTSDLRFRPTRLNQVGVFTHEAKEYREVNGKMEVVGITRLEYQVIITNGTSKTPIIKGESAVACTGQKVCVDFETDDNDKNDSTFLDFKGLPSGATVTYGRKGRLATAQVCYSPQKSDVRNNPYNFTAIVADNSCKIEGRSSSTFTFLVQEAPDSTNIEILSKTVSCSSADIILNLKNTTGLTGLSWEVFDEDNLSLSKNDTAKLFFKGSGWKKFYVNLTAANSKCTFSLEDSVFITPQYNLNLGTTADSSFCTPTNFSIATNVLNGSAPYQYSWTKENNPSFTATTAQFTQNIQVAGKHKYFVFVSDSAGCTAEDSVALTLNAPLIIDAGSYPSICGGTGSVQLKATVSAGASPYQYTWLPNNITTDTTTVTPNSTTAYILKVEDNSGCIAYDTTTIIVAPAVSFSPPNTSQVCNGSPLTLQATNIIGVSPVSFTWDGTPATSNYTFSPTQSKAVTIEMTDSNNCKTTRFVQVVVNQNPDIELGLARVVCRGTSQFVEAKPTKGKPPYSYSWSNSVTTDSFTTTIDFPRQFTVIVTDDNGCTATDDIQFQVFPKGNVNITPLPVQCEDGTPVALSTTSGGLWSGSGVSGGNLFIPQLAGIGVHKLEYNYKSTFGCDEKEETYVVVKKLPIPDFTVDKTKGIPNTQFNFTNQTTADSTYTIAWDFGDLGAPGNVSSLANPNFTYTKNGLYTVKLTVYNGVCDPQTETKTDYILIDSSTVSNRSVEGLNIELYPNPASNSITINANHEIVALSIYDIAGKQVNAATMQAKSKHSATLNISLLKSGVYTIRGELKNGKTFIEKVSIIR